MMRKFLFFIMILLFSMEAYAMQSNLTKKEKSIVEISAYTSAGDLENLSIALNQGLDNKMTINEINEILIQSYAYCGFPRSLNAISTFINVVKDRKAKGKKDIQGKEAEVLPNTADKAKIGEATREKLAGGKTIAEWQKFAPGIEQYLLEHLFADIFSRGILNHQERELATVSFLSVIKGAEPQLKAHIGMAKNTGLSEDKLNYAVYYAQFITEYNMGAFGRGAENKAYAKYFKGISYLDMLSTEGVVVGNIVFEPGCRNNWHIHHKGGQILLVTGGNGYYQEWGKKARKLKEGDVVNIPAGVKHWHGAAKDSFFAHIAIEVPAEGASNEWLEEVSDAEYNKLN